MRLLGCAIPLSVTQTRMVLSSADTIHSGDINLVTMGSRLFQSRMVLGSIFYSFRKVFVILKGDNEKFMMEGCLQK